MTVEQRITERIGQLKQELEKFVADANAKVLAYQAAIGELERLLQPDKTPGPEA